MSNSIAKRFLSFGLLALSTILLSCDEEKARIFDNPNDPSGAAWSPPTVKVLTRTVVVGMGDTGTVKVVGKDPDKADRVVRARFLYPGLLDDSVSLNNDTAVGKLKFAQPGRYAVLVSVHDNHNVWSVTWDSVVFDVHRYAPVSTLRSTKDSVEPGDTLPMAMAWTDTAGRVERFVWSSKGKTDTTKDSIFKFRPTEVGLFSVTGYAVDDDGNPSNQVVASAVVRTLNPWIVSMAPSRDTAEENKDFKVVMRGADHKPGKVAKYVWTTGSKTDTTQDSSHTFRPGVVSSFQVQGRVLDDDGYASKDSVIVVPVVRFAPTVKSLKASKDTAEVGYPVKFSMKGSDRSPGKVVKYLWSHDNKTDTTSDTTLNLTPRDSGNWTVRGQVIDDDGYVSEAVELSVPVTKYHPSVVSLRAKKSPAEAGKSLQVVMVGSDRQPGSVSKYCWNHSGKVDTTKDSLHSIPVPAGASSITIQGWVIDNDGNGSEAKSLVVPVTVYGPTATSLTSAKDTAEVGKAIVFRLRGKDSDTGKVVRWAYAMDGKIDTLKTDSAFLIPSATGKMVVWGFVIDNDGNASNMLEDTIPVARYAPTATSLSASAATVEAHRGVRFTLTATDRSPGKIAKRVFVHDGKSDTTTTDTLTLVPHEAGFWEVSAFAIDDDGNTSGIVRKTVTVTSHIPSVTSVSASPDTLEVGKRGLIRIVATDASPGKVVKWLVKIGSTTDTLAKDTTSIVPTSKGLLTLYVSVIDDDGNLSPSVVRAFQVVERKPVVGFVDFPDSSEINRYAKLKATGYDYVPGKVVKWIWSVAGVLDTTTDSSYQVRGSIEGPINIGVQGIDDDGYTSELVSRTLQVKAHAPKLVTYSPFVKVALGDTAKIARTATDAPTDPAGDSLEFRWSTNDGRSGSYKSGGMIRLTDTVAKTISLMVKAYDKDSLASPQGTIQVQFLPKAPTILTPSVGGIQTTTDVRVTWQKGYLDSAFAVYADTTEDPKELRGTTTGTSLDLALGVWDRGWTVKVVGWRGSDSATSATVRFHTAQDSAYRSILKELEVRDAMTDELYPFDTAFSSGDTLYALHTGADMAQLEIRAIGSVSKQVIRVGTGVSVADSVRSVVAVPVSPMRIPVWVASPNGVSTRTYTLVVSRDISPFAKLESFSVDAGGSLSPAFHPDTTTYVVSIHEGEQVAMSWTKNLLANVTCQNRTLWFDQDSILEGRTEDTAGTMLTVTRAGVPDNHYLVKVKVLPSRDARLNQMLWANVEWLPIDSTSFLRNLPEGTLSTWIEPQLRPGQTMTINGAAATSGVRQTLDLVPGMNTTTIKITAADRTTTRTYTLLFYRQPSTDNSLSNLETLTGGIGFSPSYQTYRLVLPFPEDSAGVKATVNHPSAWMRLDGTRLSNDTWGPKTILAPGDSVVYTIEVLAEDTTYKRPYKVTVVRSMPDTTRYLDDLALSSTQGTLNVTDGFSTYGDTLMVGATSYNDSVLQIRAYWTRSEYRSVTVGSDTLTSYTFQDFLLATPNDTNVFPVVVVAQDSSMTRTYRVKVFRGPPSRNADLSGYLSVGFNVSGRQDHYVGTGDSVFTIGVPYRDSLMSLYATPADADVFQILRDGVEIPRSEWSDSLLLVKGDTNRVEVTVVAQDTTRKKVYSLKVYRAPESQDASLSYLQFKSRLGNVNWWGVPTDSVYRVSVPWHDSLLTVNPTATDAYVRSIHVAGVSTNSGTWSDSAALSLVADTNRVSIVVKAQDSTVTRTYTVNVYREPAHTDASLGALSLSSMAGALAISPSFTGSDTEYVASTLYLDSLVVATPTVNDPVARSVTVQGVAVASGTASDSIPLAVSDTTVVTLVVTAQDGTTRRTTRVKIYRAPPSTDALLAGFGEGAGVLSPMVNDADTIYQLNVVSMVASVTLSPTLHDTRFASFTVDGSATTRIIPLGAAGTTTPVSVVVTAQDPSVKRHYTLNVVREQDPTALHGTISSDRVLTLAGSPYLVDGTVTVKADATLSIEPGVRVKFNAGTGLRIEKGTLKALGTPADPIVFTKAQAGNWAYLYFDTTAVSATYDASGAYSGGSILRNCLVEYSGGTTLAGGASLMMKGRFPHLESVVIRSSASDGIYAENLADVHWSGVEVRSSAGTGMVVWARTFALRQSILADNVGRGLHLRPTESLMLGDQWVRIDSSQFLRNRIVNGNAAGAYIGVSQYFQNMGILLRGNLFEGNTTNSRAGGLLISQEGFHSNLPITLERNVFRGNVAGDHAGALWVRTYYNYSGSTQPYEIRSVGNLIEGNSSPHVAGVWIGSEYEDGDAIGSYYDSANIYRNNTNTASTSVGAGLAMDDNRRTFRMVDSRFEGNRAGQDGGAVNFADLNGTAQVEGCTFVGNRSGLKGGAVFTRTSANFAHSLFQGNIAGTVAAISWTNNVAGRLDSNTFAGNTATGAGGSVVTTVMEIDGYPVLRGNNFLTNSTDRVLRNSNLATDPGVEVAGNWWNTATPDPFYLFVDGGSGLPGAGDLGMFTGGEADSSLASPNLMAPAVE
ncbi:MAG: cadherin-like beta sandwich domain-containing protein [Fibrobacteria bacterium]|nr:cadherin-like beta sandwich domain-containing protein [Fibrobacteria bacterium]